MNCNFCPEKQSTCWSCGCRADLRNRIFRQRANFGAPDARMGHVGRRSDALRLPALLHELRGDCGVISFRDWILMQLSNDEEPSAWYGEMPGTGPKAH